MECPYLENNLYCSLALHYRKLNQLSVDSKILVTERICLYCKEKAIPSQYYNCVTLKLSNNNNQIHQDEIDFEKECSNQKLEGIKNDRLEKVLNGDGVGSQLWKLLDCIGIKHTASCSCLDWAERMNLWGPELCDKNRKQIIEHMKKSAKSYGWGDISVAVIKAIKTGIAFKLSILDPYGSLLDEAIRLAKDAENIIKKRLIDIIIPLGTASKYQNIEIKMALRSIERYLIGYRKIIIVSPQIPKFFHENDRLQLVQKKENRCNKQARVQRKIQWAIENLDITEDFAYWNDDFLVLKPFDIRYIPNYISGEISLSNKKEDGWRETKRRTGHILKNNNKTMHNFDIHVPIIFNKEKHLLLKEWWYKSSNETPLMRSLYGNNFCENNIQQLRDVKLQQKWKTAINNILNGDRWIISYGDGALNAGFGEWMQTFFSVPSSFEQKIKENGCINCGGEVKKQDNISLDIWKKLHQDKIND